MQDGIAQYDCSCEDGWTGRNCSVNIDECDPNPCNNDGTCIVSSLDFVTAILGIGQVESMETEMDNKNEKQM